MNWQSLIAGIGLGLVLANAIHLWLFLKLQDKPRKQILIDERRTND